MRSRETSSDQISAQTNRLRTTQPASRRGRRFVAAALWLDWLPMVLLGIAIAACGAVKIGDSLQPDRPATVISVQAPKPVPHNITVMAPVEPAHRLGERRPQS